MFGYSKTTNAFYDLSREDIFIAAGTWPDDVMEVTDDIAAEFMRTPPPGKQRVARDDGLLIWADIPPPTQEEIITLAEVQQQQLLRSADSVTTDWRTELALGIISDDDREQLTAWMLYIRKVKAIDVNQAPDIIWPEKPERGSV